MPVVIKKNPNRKNDKKKSLYKDAIRYITYFIEES